MQSTKMSRPCPRTLLPTHFYVRRTKTTENLEECVANKITEFLSQQYALEFKIGITWQGSLLRASSRMAFNISLYREKEEPDTDFIVEFQRIDGSGVLFGELYQSVERMLKNKPYVYIEINDLESTEEETNKYIENAISMIEWHDPCVSLNGVQAAGEILTDKTMLSYALKTDLLKKMTEILSEDSEGYGLHKREHAMFSIAHVARTDIDGFTKYMKEKMLKLPIECLMEDENPHIARFANEINVALCERLYVSGFM